MQLSNLPFDVVAALGDILRKHEYFQKNAEERLQYKFGGWYTAYAPTYLFPLFVSTLLQKEPKPFDVLLLLFYCCQPVNYEHLKALLGDKLLKDLCLCKLLKVSKDTVEAAIQIIPFGEDLLVATELPKKTTNDVQYLSFEQDAVMTLFPDSYDLARHIDGTKAKSALDVFCGNGVHALVLAKTVDKVIGVDVNAKAIEFAKFNATLNRLKNVTFECLDVKQSMSHLGRFEIVVANPPFCPAIEQKTLFCDAGVCGDELFKVFLNERLGEIITKKGKAFILITFLLSRAEELKDKLIMYKNYNLKYKVQFIPLGQSDTDASGLSALHKFVVYFLSSRYLLNPAEYLFELKRFLHNLRNNGIESLAYGVLELSGNF